MSESWDRRVVLGISSGVSSTSPASMPSTTGRFRPEEKEPSATRRSQWYSRGYLPHFDAAGVVQHVTFHLADSLPREAVERMQQELEALPEEQRTVERRQRIQDLLDSGLGSCILGHAECARIVEDAFVFGDGTRYRLLAWVVMPNHVHVLIEQVAGWPLAKVVQAWKRHTTREIKRLADAGLGAPSCTRLLEELLSATRRSQTRRSQATQIWQRDYWDRYIRDERHFAAAKEYIEQNPVKAGLVAVAEEWAWGNARLEGYEREPSATRRSRTRRSQEDST